VCCFLCVEEIPGWWHMHVSICTMFVTVSVVTSQFGGFKFSATSFFEPRLEYHFYVGWNTVIEQILSNVAWSRHSSGGWWLTTEAQVCALVSRVGFVVNRLALGYVLSKAPGFSLSVSFQHCSVFTHTPCIIWGPLQAKFHRDIALAHRSNAVPYSTTQHNMWLTCATKP
jgi:hypothetical protein